ncbi:2-oxoglutarate dehydrogenase complex dihydrolipoyllysine-residue succinyltransferase [Paraliobacillus ryukyuensis]|uniref:2-oxoglutarate dehydrogenase complex dihydrolipoyllysine-residue succinyltransferase n=1 Tax=Paraliobacillus ryukyuensis TaxID=200904 RepID=UPI0009A79F72|nr:2-oxoglutarate dehydrogenase complex dihydrolipoyllysine-residue succinyltransferase [Paraliobacillus ryukyuensis]
MIQITVPELAESITGGTINDMFVKIGDSVKKDDPILELETDKINIEIPSIASGIVVDLPYTIGDEVKVNAIIATLEEAVDHSTVAEQVNRANEYGKKSSYHHTKRAEDYIVATPAARKRARELGIDLNQIQAADPLGRIRPADVLAHTQKTPSLREKEVTPMEERETSKLTERIKMSARRRAIANHLVEAKQQTAMLTTFNEIDMSKVSAIRAEKQVAFTQKHGVKLGFMSFFAKAVVIALKEFPMLNAELAENDIILKKYYDLGIAVATNEGLVVPVLRGVDKLDFASIEKNMLVLREKAENKKLELNDLQGGTFTITNGGVFGSLFSTPIINTPQVGILGMHTIQKRPIALADDSIAVRPMMYIALSYDHRIIDGKEAVGFLTRIKQFVENPYELLVET